MKKYYFKVLVEISFCNMLMSSPSKERFSFMELPQDLIVQSLAMVVASHSFDLGGIIRFHRSLDGKFEKKQVKTDPFNVLLVDTMLPKNTFEMISRVKALKTRYPKSAEHLFDCIDELVKASINEEGSLVMSSLIGAIRINQNVLKTIGVSCKAIDEIVQLAEKHHFAAKLTGGGGGGCVVAIRETACDEDENELLKELNSLGYETLIVQLGGEGIQLEHIEWIV